MATRELMEAWLLSHERILDSLPRPSGGALDAEAPHKLQTWDMELAKMRNAFSSALERRNELAPISSLPAELLTRIFGELVEIWPVNSYDLDESRDYHYHYGGWTRIALRVCRRWRSIAIDYGPLWATISTDGHEPIDLFLERARGFPLSVIGVVNCDNYHWEKQRRRYSRIEHLMGYSARFRRLDVTVYGLTNIFDHLTTQSSIENLSVHSAGTRGYSFGSDYYPTNQHCGPSRAFISTLAPRLESISLKGYLFPWGAGSSSLRSLTLNWAGSHFSHSYTFVDVLDSLRAMPALEQLVLIECLPDVDHPDQDFIQSQSVISLHRLQDMQLLWNNEQCWVLWALLDTHPSASITIYSAYLLPPELLEMAFLRHIHRLYCPDYTALKMWGTYDTSLSITLSNPDDVDDESESATGVGVRLHFRSELRNDISLRILRIVPLQKLELFSISGAWWSYDDIAPLFEDALRLRCIKLRETDAARVFCSLLIPERILSAQTPNETAISSLPLPSLTELHIDRVDLTTSTSDFHPDCQLSLGDQLALALGVRQASRGRIHLLSVNDSNVTSDWVPRWESLVTNVDWDGQVTGKDRLEQLELSREKHRWGPSEPDSDHPVSGSEWDEQVNDGQSVVPWTWPPEGPLPEDGGDEWQDGDEEQEDQLEDQDEGEE